MGLFLLTLLVLAIRLTFAFQTPHFTGGDAYLHLRSIDHLAQGNYLHDDPLGYEGRILHFSPLFDIILSMFTFFIPTTIALKLIPNILGSLLIIPVFFIAQQLTKTNSIAYLSATLAAIVPPFLSTTFNHISTLSLAIPLFFTLAYIWIRLPKHIPLYLGLLFLFSLLHPLSLVFVLSISLYVLLLVLEHKKPPYVEIELALFSLFFTLWTQFLIYKKPILYHGPSVIWQNIPQALLTNFFTDFTILSALWHIGIITLIGGTYAIYRTTIKKPQRHSHLLLSITLVTLFLLWLRLIPLTTGLTLLGITLAIAFAPFLANIKTYLRNTKLTSKTTTVAIIISILAIITTAYPAYTSTYSALDNTITQEEVNALLELQNTTTSDAIIIAPSHYGHYITALANRTNVIDDYYLMQPQIDERYEDITRVYTTTLETEATRLFNKYHATHLIVPPNMRDIRYGETRCFNRIHATNIKIYEKDVRCRLRVIA